MKRPPQLLVILILAASAFGLADEGMWTFDNPPLERLKGRYGFTPTKEWLDHLRLSSVRLSDRGIRVLRQPAQPAAVYDDKHNRAVTVHPAAVLEALQKLCGAGKLADELSGK